MFTQICFAQIETDEELQKQRDSYESQLKGQQELTKKNKDQLEAEIKAIADKKAELASIDTYEQNFGQNKMVAIDEISEKIKKLPIFQKLGSKAAFYKCLRSSLQDNNQLNYDNCYRYNTPNFNEDEQADVSRWKVAVGMSPLDIKSKKENLPRQIQASESLLQTWKNTIKYSESREEMLKGSINTIDIQKKELSLLPKNTQFTSCDENTPVIDLEQKEPFPGANFQGPFFNIPRDNQDGLGTCYANAAKNLLVGVSGGKDVASFLDIALAYKKDSGGLATSGLDAGNSCVALNAVKKFGFCPQHFSPVETGERNIVGEGLFNLDAYNYLATNVNLVRDFLGDLTAFQKSTNEISNTVLSKAQSMIAVLRANPDIKIPMPVARFDIPENWKLKESYSLYGKPKGFKEEEFYKDYSENYKNFYPLYVKSVMQGKTLDQIFDIWKEKMEPFISKYGLTGSLPEYKRVFKIDAEPDMKDPKLKAQIRKSLDFLKDVMGKNDVADEEFIQICSNQGSDTLNFLSSFHPLMEKLRSGKLNDENLFDKDGKFRSADELMQLTVAPSCINEENRVKPEPFTCRDGWDVMGKIRKSGKSNAEQVQMFRNKILLSLLQGYPLGNSFNTMSGAGHINTIVGLRFNKDQKRCEYLIRESQTGTSGWHAEQGIFDKIDSLTEVRREK